MAANMYTPDWTIREYRQWLRNPRYFTNGLIHVRTLRLSNIPLDEIPERIEELGQLRQLEITNTTLRSLPKTIGRLVNLTHLILDDNLLGLLPNSIGRLENLKVLRISNNLLESLPASLTNLTQLERLDLDENQLTALPERIGNLTALEDLEVFNNQLTTLPESICNLTQLRLLFLYDNQLTALPECIGDLANLEQLDITNNNVRTFPNSIVNLAALEVLSAENNQLTALPENIGNLTNLWSLELSNNQLESLPESIGNLEALEELGLRNNPLVSLPESITNLRQLRRLHVERDTVAVPPELQGILQEPEVNNNDNNNNDNNDEPPPNGIAFQVHRAFQRVDLAALKTFFRDAGVPRMEFRTNNEFQEYLSRTFRELIDEAEGDKEKLLRDFNTIYSRILGRLVYEPETIEILSLALEFVKRQPANFIGNYLINYIHDTLYAYGTNAAAAEANGSAAFISCGKGAMERIITGLVPAATLFADKEDFRTRSYDRLVSIITATPLQQSIDGIFRRYAQECHGAHPEDVNGFRNCMKGKMREALGDAYNEAEANAALGPLVESLGIYGGSSSKRKRRTRRQRRSKKTQKRTRKSKKRSR